MYYFSDLFAAVINLNNVLVICSIWNWYYCSVSLDEHSRVRLPELDNDILSTYINANYMRVSQVWTTRKYVVQNIY